MIRENLAAKINTTVSELINSGMLPNEKCEAIELADSNNTAHGDFACNFALTHSKIFKKNPREIAQVLAEEIQKFAEVEKVEIAGPGFINIFLKPTAISSHMKAIIDKGTTYSHSKASDPKKILVEFVSVNPNGPVTIGSGRGAAFGDTLCRILEANGHTVSREFYVNDGINSEQMQLFAKSVIHYVRENLKLETTFPEGGYKGAYVGDVANIILSEQGSDSVNKPLDWFQKTAEKLMIERQRRALEKFGVVFDKWFSEQTLHDSNAIDESLKILEKRNESYEKDGALWLKSTAYGDDKDRVIIRSNGRPAYIASDIAYHKNKFERGFDKLIDIMGPDHHGYIARMNAVIQSLGYQKEQFELVIYQIVRFLKDGQPAPMRKRDGNIYELEDLIDEIGADTARFFYLMRSHDTHMDFDIDLATKQGDENPVFYAQYAHARICSILRKANELQLNPKLDHIDKLTDPRELALIKKIADLPFEVRRCAEDYGVHRLTTYAVELARAFHHFYDGCRVIQEDRPALSMARLTLCQATQIGLQSAFQLLGVSAPEYMERKTGA